MTERYIHIRNWGKYQHPDTTRTKANHAAIPWIKDYTGQLHDAEFLELSYAERGLLESLRLQYALNRGRGILDSTTNHARTTKEPTGNLSRLLGQRVYRSQLERLNHAGLIMFSASRTQAESAHDAGTEVETEREEEKNKEKTPSYEGDQTAKEPFEVTSMVDFKARAERLHERARRTG